jgi:addiction module HigA family antidote
MHPGEILREEFMVPMGISANALAIALRVPATRISQIVNERRGITADTAYRLATYFGTSAELWMNLQTAYELSAVQHTTLRAIRKEVQRQVA